MQTALKNCRSKGRPWVTRDKSGSDQNMAHEQEFEFSERRYEFREPLSLELLTFLNVEGHVWLVVFLLEMTGCAEKEKFLKSELCCFEAPNLRRDLFVTSSSEVVAWSEGKVLSHRKISVLSPERILCGRENERLVHRTGEEEKKRGDTHVLVLSKFPELSIISTVVYLKLYKIIPECAYCKY